MSKRLNITPEMVAWHLTNEEIKGRYGISNKTIAEYRKIYGIPLKRGGKKEIFIPSELIQLDKTAKENAKILNIRLGLLYSFLRKNKIKLPRYASESYATFKKYKPCPRCGARSWQKEPDGQYYYCAAPTPNDPFFTRCWYHRVPKVKYGGAA